MVDELFLLMMSEKLVSCCTSVCHLGKSQKSVSGSEESTRHGRHPYSEHKARVISRFRDGSNAECLSSRAFSFLKSQDAAEWRSSFGSSCWRTEEALKAQQVLTAADS